MLKKFVQAAALRRIAARTPAGAAAVLGLGWYVRRRRRARGTTPATAN